MLKFLSKIFSLKQAPQPSTKQPISRDLVTEAWVCIEAFDKVFTEIKVSQTSRDGLRDLFITHHQSGGDKESKNALVDALIASDYQWPDFDAWAEHFRCKGEWPYMWKQYPEVYLPMPEMPNCITGALKYLSVANMRDLLKQKGKSFKPALKKRSEFECAIVENITIDDIIDIIPQCYKQEVETFLSNKQIGRASLLIHTLNATTFALRNKYQRARLPNKVKLATSTAGCPVEDEFAKQYMKGKIDSSPPFFPGDRTILRSVFPHRASLPK